MSSRTSRNFCENLLDNNKRKWYYNKCPIGDVSKICPGGGMADAEDSKSFVGNNVGVQVPSRAPK